MEGAELIIQEINREAEQKIQYILSEAQKEAEKIKEEARKRAEDRAQWILRKAKTQAEMEKQRAIASARLEVRKKRLEVQEEMIRAVLSALRERLASLPADEYFQTLVTLTTEALEELNIDSAVVRSNEETLKLIVEKLPEFKKSVSEKLGKEVEITVGEPISTIGGVLVESSDGSVRVDNTFEARIERLEADLRARIAKALFG
ncbi:archaeal/vacuolar-type H+-ATPase, subunit E [Thermococcus kodakarensis KOD1]|uniref:A-type ATP synthase subunit E n=1 Tax=Thermococcus kodakarensis (strain ATCC BAA-918 / JCM 12380 / KOD1) TaxID=69014 RepID=AATE_THEKO|nr:V-type ATP synthase subunit E [Thermococcus kodakarensis]Q5JDS0.1 RecName: Full=V-type ATP synthase subunit E; AltName: Full=V-ATPase subunit E [Thermococcus kodakarensis KOD1]WCN27539.1 V-type ATP synthase subunit E [Thermococcus kodakarensis]WCN29830.1 V-type ATP synthase subunit E [Thermococcus kodakarensis]BAD85788.1 archaeal/vacuolar-type H+-ATPase, subunit E [Thermococcus kodakarensis KOD1]